MKHHPLQALPRNGLPGLLAPLLALGLLLGFAGPGQAASLSGVAWSGSQLVTVGSAGAIRTSPDGIAWTTRTSGTTQDLYGVAWSGAQFAAVGDGGTLLTSPDGIIWTTQSSGTTQLLFGVAWSGYQFIAVGAGGALLTSPDGIAWTAQASGTTQDLLAVAWSGRQFVAVGANGAKVALARPWGDDKPLAGNGWTLLGLPADPLDPTVQGVFGNTLAGTYGTDWVVWRRDAAADQYVKLPVSEPLAQGAGYWLKQYGASPAVLALNPTHPATPVAANPNCPSIAGCYEIPLTAPASGNALYNLIGMPFPYPVGWWEVRVEVDGTAHRLNAPANLYVAPTYWVWNGNGYDTYDGGTPGMAGLLQPWQGAWIQVNAASLGHTVKLLIPRIPKYSHTAPPAPPAGGWLRALDWLIAPAVAAAEDGRAWYVRLIAEEATQKLRDRNNVLGQLADGAVGYDARDLPELAPFGQPWLTVVFPHPDWGKNAGDYASDYRPDREPGIPGRPTADWRFEIRADRAGYPVRLRWEGPPDVLSRSELLDEDTGARYPADDPRYLQDGVPATMTTPTRHFTWRYAGQPDR
ncbi:MAG: hypothetical protein WAV07_03150 [Candidatus Contendobacter sp.]